MIALPTIIGRGGAWRQMAKPIRVVIGLNAEKSEGPPNPTENSIGLGPTLHSEPASADVLLARRMQ
jgi:hypothetical protein